MKAKQEVLQQEVMAMGQAMYQGADAAGGGEGGGGPPPPGSPGAGAPGTAPDDVIDAEFSSDKDTKPL
jgi:L1 cell adhesion molecule like protein